MTRLLRNGLLGAGLAAILAAAPSAHSSEPATPAEALAKRLTVTTCGTCHGVHGVSAQPKMPNLAGQSAGYLATQLKAFRAQTRGDSDAISYMWGMAAPLDDDTIEALAGLYGSYPATAALASADGALVARGKTLYQEGKIDEGVPACAACHGADAHGTADFPRLAGQHAQYLLKQLDSFQSNMRNVAVMHGVAAGLNYPEMRAVAAYLQTLP